MRKLKNMNWIIALVGIATLVTACGSPDSQFGPNEGEGWFTDGEYVWSQAEAHVVPGAAPVGFSGRHSTYTAFSIWVDPVGYPVADPFPAVKARRCEGASMVMLDGNDPRVAKLNGHPTIWVAFELHEFERDRGFKDFRKCEIQKVRLKRDDSNTELLNLYLHTEESAS